MRAFLGYFADGDAIRVETQIGCRQADIAETYFATFDEAKDSISNLMDLIGFEQEQAAA